MYLTPNTQLHAFYPTLGDVASEICWQVAHKEIEAISESLSEAERCRLVWSVYADRMLEKGLEYGQNLNRAVAAMEEA